MSKLSNTFNVATTGEIVQQRVSVSIHLVTKVDIILGILREVTA